VPKSSYADITMSWSILTKSLEEDVLDPGVDACRRELEAALAEVLDRQRQQDFLRGQMAANHTHLQETIERGKEAEERLRAFLKGTYGGKSNQLIRFGLRPRRGRRRTAGENGAEQGEEQEPRAERGDSEARLGEGS
jgi:hypothetical protein